MTVVLYLAILVAGGTIGFLYCAFLTNGGDSDPQPSRFNYYANGYMDGHTDAGAGIWRGGPLR